MISLAERAARVLLATQSSLCWTGRRNLVVDVIVVLDVCILSNIFSLSAFCRKGVFVMSVSAGVRVWVANCWFATGGACDERTRNLRRV